MTDDPTPVLAQPHQKHGLLAVSLGMIAVGLIVFAVAVIVAVRAPSPWNPLGDYPEQKVLSRVPGIEGPAVLASDAVTVEGTKCARVAVRVRGGSFWQSVDVPGTFVSAGSGVADKSAGCVTRTFVNPIPPAVAQASKGKNGPHRWIIAGTETPIRPDGKREGVPRAWATQEFVVIP